jgi:hypothetical protein
LKARNTLIETFLLHPVVVLLLILSNTSVFDNFQQRCRDAVTEAVEEVLVEVVVVVEVPFADVEDAEAVVVLLAVVVVVQSVVEVVLDRLLKRRPLRTRKLWNWCVITSHKCKY